MMAILFYSWTSASCSSHGEGGWVFFLFCWECFRVKVRCLTVNSTLRTQLFTQDTAAKPNPGGNGGPCQERVFIRRSEGENTVLSFTQGHPCFD